MTERRTITKAYTILINNWRFLFFMLLLLVTFLRSPLLFIEPRFWAEEGTIYFSKIFRWHFFEGLFFAFPRAGYFNLVPNIACLLAKHLVPLPYAPFITTYSALVIQMIPFSIILWGHSFLWQKPFQKCIGCLIILFIPTSIGEVWLNTINSHVYCGLTALALIFESTQGASPKKIVLYSGLQILGGLTGLYAISLIFVFVIKCYKERTLLAKILLGSLLLTAMIQAGLVLHFKNAGLLNPKRISSRATVTQRMANAGYHHLIVPICGPDWGPKIADKLDRLVHLFKETGANWIFIGGAFIFLYFLVWHPPSLRKCLLFSAFLSVSSFGAMGAFDGVPGGRYAFLPGIIFITSLFIHIDFAIFRAIGKQFAYFNASNLLVQITRLLLLICSLSIGVMGYRDSKSINCPNCPKWPNEVAKWMADNTYYPIVWPKYPDKPDVTMRVKLIRRF